MILNVSALAGFVFGVVEVAVVATPAALSVSAFTGLVFRVEPPVLLVHSSSTAFHVVACGVANMAGCAGPVVLGIVALGTSFISGDIPLAVFAVPIVFNIAAFRASLVLGYFKVTVFAQPPHLIINDYFQLIISTHIIGDNKDNPPKILAIQFVVLYRLPREQICLRNSVIL